MVVFSESRESIGQDGNVFIVQCQGRLGHDAECVDLYEHTVFAQESLEGDCIFVRFRVNPDLRAGSA